MKDYIVDDEQRLSPIVVATTAVLVAIFLLGVFYRLGTALL
jgi:hypothetical protein